MFDDLRGFIDACRAKGYVRDIRGVSWDLEMGALVEAIAETVPEPPLVLFDDFPGYPRGHRVASLPLASYRRAALALGLPHEGPKMEVGRLAARKVQAARPIPAATVGMGPAMENVREGDAIDMLAFPVPRFHPLDGGRYIGSGDGILMRDPASGWVNMGKYRVQVHGPQLLGLWMSPGQQGRQICDAYWRENKSCPVVAIFGCDPLTLMASSMKLPIGMSELEFVGGLRGRPLDVIAGPLTGLPIPASAEIAIEGEVPPPALESREEGPYGEWPGYYSGGSIGTGKPQPVIRVRALYFRSDPILVDEAPLWPGARGDDLQMPAGLLWDQLEAAGVQDIVGVWTHTPYLVVVAIRQRYPGHAKQAGLGVIACGSRARNGRYVVIVDDDIDPSNLKEVLWAMTTRVDPASDIEIVDGCWSTPLDPRMPPERKRSGDHTNSRAIFYAVRPFGWRAEFPTASRSDPDLMRKMLERFGGGI